MSRETEARLDVLIAQVDKLLNPDLNKSLAHSTLSGGEKQIIIDYTNLKGADIKRRTLLYDTAENLVSDTYILAPY